MSTLTASSCLQANLDSLGRRNAELAERLRSIEPRRGVSLVDTADGVPAVLVDERSLCSKVRPMQEATRLVDGIDLIEHAVVVVLGFGAGWHVQRLAERGRKSTLMVVFEPDLALLRAVLETIDHSSWLRDALVLFVTEAQDRGLLAAKLAGAEAILGQGVHVLEHPASRERLGESATRFTAAFSEQVAGARTTLATTLMRSVDTTRNLLRNIDQYAAGAGIADLEGAAAGWPAVVVSAGPSLHRNMMLLAQPGVRDTCVIIAVQTALRPLLEAGIKPHFVTALDYHEISRRFYEQLDASALQDVTLVAEPKVHPVVLDLYPGPIRCCGNGFLDRALGEAARPMGDLPAGATVAHLAVYLARHLGCDPVALIGQDLGFPDGLYYAPHAVIHETWAPELNPFNTIAMMEWQRIVRHRLHLKKTQDVHGRSIFTDAQMHAYLQQFERDFAGYAQNGLTTIDASEGGVRKQHTIAMPLSDFLHAHAKRPLPSFPNRPEPKSLDAARLKQAEAAISAVRGKVQRLGELSRETEGLLTQMLEHQRDPARMNSLFKRVEANRGEVERLMDAFELLNLVNQMGAFRRLKADRRLQMSKGLDALTVQRRQLERDLENVRWLADAAVEVIAQFDDGLAALRGDSFESRACTGSKSASQSIASSATSAIDALIPIDPKRNGRGIARSLAQPFAGRTVLQATLERLGESTALSRIILIAPEGFDIESLIDRSRIGMPVEIEPCPGESPFGPEQRAIAAARAFADTCWRGGIAGIGVYDEALCPQTMSAIMERRSLTAALIAAPDWPLIDVTGESGCDALVRRHLEQPQQHNLVFAQAPPGLGGCVISASLMKELAQRNRLSTVGGLLVYQPHAPQGDPIARDACVQSPHAVKTSLIRATFDSRRQHSVVTQAAPSLHDLESASDAAFARAPQRLVLELTTQRTSRGVFARSLGCGTSHRSPMELAAAKRIFEQLAATGADDMVLSLHGAGDPLLHPQFDAIIAAAKQAGFLAINLRTELLCDRATLDRLLAADVDVISVDLNADRAVTYAAMMGFDRFKGALLNIEHVLANRRRLTTHPGTAAFALPWVVPHLQRRAETYEDIDTFFDRWQHALGAAVIDDPPPGDPRPIGLTPAITPSRVLRRDAMRCMTVLCDGTVPLFNNDFSGNAGISSLAGANVEATWRLMRERRSVRLNGNEH